MREYNALMARFERTDHRLTGASESAQPKQQARATAVRVGGHPTVPGAARGLVAFARGSGSSRLAPASSVGLPLRARSRSPLTQAPAVTKALRALRLSRLLRFLHVLSEDDETVEDVHAQGESAETPPRISAAD